MLRLLPVLLLIFLSSCRRQTQAHAAMEEGVLLVGNASDPKTLDPHQATGVIEAKILTALFEGLVADHPSEDDGLLPGGAINWESNAEHTEWTFFLRPDARWSDGVPVTAADYLFAYQRILHPETAAPYASMLYPIKGARAYNKGETDDFGHVGVRALDDFTLHFTLREPVAFLPYLTRHFTWFPLPRHLVDNPLHYHNSPYESFSSWTRAEHLVGNGPFRIKEWRFNDFIEVEANPYYWDHQQVSLRAIRYLVMENSYTETRAFLAGQLHTTYRVPSDLLEHLSKTQPNALRQEPYVGTIFLRLNTHHPALSDPRVRQALSLAINRSDLTRYVYEGYQTTSSFTPEMGSYQPNTSLPFDPAKARQLLAEAGYPEGKNFPRLQILIGRGDARPPAETLQAMWREHLGIHLDVRLLDWSSYLNAQRSLDYDLSLSAWIGDYLDPTTFLNLWIGDDGNNRTGRANSAYEDILQRAAREPDPQQRLRTLAEAEKLLLTELPILPLAHYTRLYLHHPRILGWHPLLLDNHPWKWIKFSPAQP